MQNADITRQKDRRPPRGETEGMVLQSITGYQTLVTLSVAPPPQGSPLQPSACSSPARSRILGRVIEALLELPWFLIRVRGDALLGRCAVLQDSGEVSTPLWSRAGGFRKILLPASLSHVLFLI